MHLTPDGYPSALVPYSGFYLFILLFILLFKHQMTPFYNIVFLCAMKQDPHSLQSVYVVASIFVIGRVAMTDKRKEVFTNKMSETYTRSLSSKVVRKYSSKLTVMVAGFFAHSSC